MAGNEPPPSYRYYESPRPVPQPLVTEPFSSSTPYYQSSSSYPSAAPAALSPPSHSPFDTPFDDQMYPLVGSPHPPPPPPPPPRWHDHADEPTEYMGAGRSSIEDIPLQDRQPPLGPDNDKFATFASSHDHIYDAPAVADSSGRGPDKRGKLSYGQLGMMAGRGKKRIPFVVYTITLIQIAVFIAEIAKYGILTGIPIQTQPSVNPMIGPSIYLLVNMGARYMPCMHNVDGIQSSTKVIEWPCPNTTTQQDSCTLSDLCGFGGVAEPLYQGNSNQSPQPNQWFRFITAMFLHSGLVHIGFNLFLQLSIGPEMEQLIGPIRFFLVYMSAGIFGFVFGGNFAGTTIASTGASGALFGVIGLVLLDLLYSWTERHRPWLDLLFIGLEVVVSFVLGLLIPFMDNFSHIGGFLVGLAGGICVLHSPNFLRRRIVAPTYAPVSPVTEHPPPLPAPTEDDRDPFHRNPVGFFAGRRALWWGWWLLRVGALVLIISVFIVLLNTFYSGKNTCSWCHYLNCININGQCDNINFREQNITSEPA